MEPQQVNESIDQSIDTQYFSTTQGRNTAYDSTPNIIGTTPNIIGTTTDTIVTNETQSILNQNDSSREAQESSVRLIQNVSDTESIQSDYQFSSFHQEQDQLNQSQASTTDSSSTQNLFPPQQQVLPILQIYDYCDIGITYNQNGMLQFSQQIDPNDFFQTQQNMISSEESYLNNISSSNQFEFKFQFSKIINEQDIQQSNEANLIQTIFQDQQRSSLNLSNSQLNYLIQNLSSNSLDQQLLIQANYNQFILNNQFDHNQQQNQNDEQITSLNQLTDQSSLSQQNQQIYQSRESLSQLDGIQYQQQEENQILIQSQISNIISFGDLFEIESQENEQQSNQQNIMSHSMIQDNNISDQQQSVIISTPIQVEEADLEEKKNIRHEIFDKQTEMGQHQSSSDKLSTKESLTFQ